MQCSVHYRFINVDITVPDFQVEATLRIGAYPGFVINGRPLGAKIRQGYQITGIALLTLGETELFQRVHLPTGTRLPTVYTKGLRFDKPFPDQNTAIDQASISYRAPAAEYDTLNLEAGLTRGHDGNVLKRRIPSSSGERGYTYMCGKQAKPASHTRRKLPIPTGSCVNLLYEREQPFPDPNIV